MSNGDDLAKGGLFATIEKATDFNFFLLATTFVLFLDSVLVLLHDKGIIDVIQNSSNLNLSLALEVSLIFLGFSFCMSIILPAVGSFLDAIYIEYISGWFMRLGTIGQSDENRIDYRRKHNCVRPQEILDAAHEQQSSFLLNIYEQHWTDYLEQLRASRLSAFYSFSLAVLVIVNYWYISGATSGSIMRATTARFDSSAIIFCALIFLSILTYRRFHLHDRDSSWLYHPPLYRELLKEEERRKAELEDMLYQKKMNRIDVDD
jgi:hypothetical protein